MSGCQIIHFIDNDAAASSLVRGYSPKTDSTALVGEYWSLAAQHGLEIYIDRVESKSNLADGPSCFQLHDLHQLHATHVQASLIHHTNSILPFFFSRAGAAFPLTQSR